MFVLIWATLLFSVRGNNLVTGCSSKFCFTFNEGEISAEAGLCAVVSCSFSTDTNFTPPQAAVWFKCDPAKQKCSDNDIIFHSKNASKVQAGFLRRVFLLEPDLTRKNCSIIVNDLTVSDSGSYQIRMNVKRGKPFGSDHKANVTIKDLTQKPTLMVPALMEGEQTTLTCTAPGRCSGSAPNITWMWREKGQNASHVARNATAYTTENLTAVTQRHSSTLTFNPSVKHHGTEVTCKVTFKGGVTTEETFTLNMSYMRDVEISGERTVEEGDVLNLTCSAESFPPSRITWTKLEFNKNLSDVNDAGSGTETDRRNATENDQVNDTESDLQSRAGEATLIIPNVTAEHSGRYICTAKHQSATHRAEADVTVTYTKKPEISGKSVVKKGDALNLTCSVESFPPSVVTWTKHGGSKNLHNQTKTEVQNGAAKATLVIPNVTAEDTGRYICTAEHLNNTLMENADVTLMSLPNILNLSVCVLRSELLTCVCISKGVPLPSIRWPLFENHTEHPPVTTASSYTVNSIIILPMKDGGNTTVECVSSNEMGEVKGNLNIIKNNLGQEDEPTGFLGTILQMEMIIAFFCGAVLVAAICCLAKICHRKKPKSSRNQAETLELVTSEENRLINDDQGAENHKIHHQEADGGGADCDGRPNDVEYANIEFSLLKRKSPSEAAKEQEGAETEYAEIKTNQTQDSGGEQGQVLDAEEEEEEEEEEIMIEEDEEVKHNMPEEEDGEEVPLYSNEKDDIEED